MPLKQAGEPALDVGPGRVGGMPGKKLSSGCDQFFISSRGLQTVDQFQHHVLVPGMRGVQPDKGLGKPDQSKRPAVVVIEIDDLQQLFATGLAAAVELRKVGFQHCRLFADEVQILLIRRRRRILFLLRVVGNLGQSKSQDGQKKSREDIVAVEHGRSDLQRGQSRDRQEPQSHSAA